MLSNFFLGWHQSIWTVQTKIEHVYTLLKIINNVFLKNIIKYLKADCLRKSNMALKIQLGKQL